MRDLRIKFTYRTQWWESEHGSGFCPEGLRKAVEMPDPPPPFLWLVWTGKEGEDHIPVYAHTYSPRYVGDEWCETLLNEAYHALWQRDGKLPGKVFYVYVELPCPEEI